MTSAETAPTKPQPTMPIDKNSVMRLNELYKDLVYQLIESDGPVHEARYVISVEVNGMAFVGEGKSKKIAKNIAADKALRSLNPGV